MAVDHSRLSSCLDHPRSAQYVCSVHPGKVLESVYGHGRFLLLYFISAFAGNVASFVLSANNSLGASTAIFGLIGAEAIFVIRNKRFFGNRYQSTLTNIGVIIALNLAIGFMARHIDRLLGTYWRFDRR